MEGRRLGHVRKILTSYGFNRQNSPAPPLLPGDSLLQIRRQLVSAAALFLLALVVASAQAEKVYVTRTGAKYHRAGCSSLRASAIEMSLVEAAARYGACANCRPPVPGAAPAHQPLGLTAPPGAAVAVDRGAPSASTPVVITRTEQKYHREGCRTLRVAASPAPWARRQDDSGRVACAVRRSWLHLLRLPLRPAVPARSGRCQATTQEGTQCSRTAKSEAATAGNTEGNCAFMTRLIVFAVVGVVAAACAPRSPQPVARGPRAAPMATALDVASNDVYIRVVDVGPGLSLLCQIESA